MENFISDIYFGNKRTRLIDEVEDYLFLPREPGDTKNLDYWRGHFLEWPCLAKLALDFLPVTATSALSERALSVGRDMLGICLQGLKPYKMEACMCVRS